MPGQRRRKQKRSGTTSLASASAPSSPDSFGGVRRRNLLTNQDEGVLYTMKVAERPPHSQLKNRNRRLFRRDRDAPTTEVTAGESNEEAPPPQSSAVQPVQYSISKMQIDNSSYCSRLCRSFGVELSGHDAASAYVYHPSKPLAKYINWTFNTSFTAVFLTFFLLFFIFCLIFACLLALAGEFTPECLIVSSEPYGTNPNSKFSDAFAMSWTTFTTVGYGNVYTATGNDFVTNQSEICSGVVFLCTLESFFGLIYAGMCAAILFGKVNRIQSHAHLTFANTVCLQYADVDSDFVDEDSSDSDCDSNSDGSMNITEQNGEEEIKAVGRRVTFKFKLPRKNFKEKFKGCPVLTFQVVNDLCNKRGGEIIDCLMKVVGVKHKRYGGKISHAQLVRVNLVDSENPFFGTVWHGTHILDESSPLLTQAARHKIKMNGGSWPDTWLRVDNIRRKLDFQNLIVTVAGISNLSACSVYGYKWYKLDDVIFGFDFAPLLYENEQTGKLEVDLGLVNDVREQCKGSGEKLENPPSDSSRRVAFQRGTSIFHGRNTN